MMNKIGIIAGQGEMPVLIARGAKQKRYGVYVAGVAGVAKKQDYEGLADKFESMGLGKLGKAISFFKENGVKQIIMAGRVKHVVVFSDLLPDLRTAKALAALKDFRTETLLNGVINEFEKDGLEFVSSAMFLEDFLPKAGTLTKRAPSDKEHQTITFGVNIAKQLAAVDVGLTAVLAGKTVVALEGMEGTDLCIQRAGELYDKTEKKLGKLVVVKAARPKQDFRFDLPVIGVTTIQTMITAGAGLLAVEAGKTLVLNLPEVIKLADKHNISIVAF